MAHAPATISTTFAEWQAWRDQDLDWLPVVARLSDCTLPSSWMDLAPGPVSTILESGGAGRWSYFSDLPARVIIGGESNAEIRSGDLVSLMDRKIGGPLEVVQAVLATRKPAPLRLENGMSGGLFALFGYDVVRTWERLPRRAKVDLGIPLYVLVEPRELFIFDHATSELTIVEWRDVAAISSAELAVQFDKAVAAAELAACRWRSPAGATVPRSHAHSSPTPDRTATFTSEGFQAAVCRVKDYIAAGDSYQVNLSVRGSQPTGTLPGDIFEAVRTINPSPYMGLSQLPDFALICGSPELLVRLVDGRLSSRPIAGTRRRGDDAHQDARHGAELLESEKERAEHLMLLDLIRNDLGRVAKFGSVSVSEFMATERYSHVMHLVSQVEAELAERVTWRQVFESMFPGGTITGCPKIRTMAIIEELEPVARGYYTGALGWISYEGNMTFNIIIRSILLQNGIAHVQSGAGIVADSEPEREYDEVCRKAEALWRALEQCERA